MGHRSVMNINNSWLTAFQVLSSLVLIQPARCDRTIFNCTFEIPAYCNFRQDAFDDFDWELFYSPAGPSSLVSYSDHTLGSTSEEGGHFARLYSNGGDAGQASIMTPPMTLTQNTAEVSFYYHMWDPELAKNQMFAGELNVYACNKRLVWTKSGNLGDVWYKATFRFECSGEFHVTFQGIIGGGTPDIAIDDVNITDCFNQTTTTVRPLITTKRVNLTTLPAKLPAATTVQTAMVTSPTTGVPIPDQNTTVNLVTPNQPILTYETHTAMTASPSSSMDYDVTSPEGTPILPNGGGVISEEVAVSLVLVAVLLFASTCLLLFLTLILHCFKCCCNGNQRPAHIIYHAPSYINPDARLGPEEYMHLNLNGRRASASTTTGTEFLTLSDRGGSNKSQDRSSFSSFSGSRPTTRLLGRRTSRTFPGVRDIKNFLHDIHFRRIRTFSSHVTAAELDVVRRRLESSSRIHSHRDRTTSTILLERSGSSVRPVSEISEHFYYSLFPEPNPGDYAMDSDSSRSSLVDFRVEVPARVGTIELLSHPSRAHRRRTNSSNLRIIWTSEGGAVSDLPQVESQSPQQSQEMSTSEMVENEIYESYSEDEVKC